MSLADVFARRERWAVEECDCRFGLACLPDDSIDCIVTDPPYELGFMGRRWDSTGIAFSPAVWQQLLRICKPGAHVLGFGATRTYHRLACAAEDAGFEIRDCLAWLYGQAMPHGLDVAKALDKRAGAERKIMRPGKRHPSRAFGAGHGDAIFGAHAGGVPPETAPATAEAKQWDGWTTALKPALEPIVMARKPFDGAVVDNVLAYGTGAINVDGCRIAAGKEYEYNCAKAARCVSPHRATSMGHIESDVRPDSFSPEGRWPANVLLGCGCESEDHERDCAVRLLDEQAGERKAGIAVTRNGGGGKIFNGQNRQGAVPDSGYSDSGGASRFFYTAKANRAERDRGLEGERNVHTTVKPVDLMRYLVRLVCPPGGIVLDPFCGSGTTGVATMLEGDGRRFVGFDFVPLHVDYSRLRISHTVGGTVELQSVGRAATAPVQPSLFARVR